MDGMTLSLKEAANKCNLDSLVKVCSSSIIKCDYVLVHCSLNLCTFLLGKQMMSSTNSDLCSSRSN